MKWFYCLMLGMSFHSLSSAQVSQSQLDVIGKNRVINVCVWPDFYDEIYSNSGAENSSNLDMDMALEFAKELSVQAKFVQSNPSKVANQLINGICDVATFGIPLTDKMIKLIRFTKPIFATDLYAITAKFNRRIKNWDDLKKPDAIVLVKKNSDHESLIKSKFKTAKVQVVNWGVMNENAIESGRADAIITDYLEGKSLISSKDWARVLMPSDIYKRTLYAYASNFNDPVLGDRLDRFVKDIKRDGRLMDAAKVYKIESIVVTR